MPKKKVHIFRIFIANGKMFEVEFQFGRTKQISLLFQELNRKYEELRIMVSTFPIFDLFKLTIFFKTTSLFSSKLNEIDEENIRLLDHQGWAISEQGYFEDYIEEPGEYDLYLPTPNIGRK